MSQFLSSGSMRGFRVLCRAIAALMAVVAAGLFFTATGNPAVSISAAAAFLLAAIALFCAASPRFVLWAHPDVLVSGEATPSRPSSDSADQNLSRLLESAPDAM